MITSIEEQERMNNRVGKDGYPIMDPFVAGVERASNVRIYYDAKCQIWPYNGEPGWGA